MSFLENLYSNEYFVPVLFTVIAVLAILFVITLILAIRDAKRSKGSVIIEEPKNADAFSSVSTPEMPLDFKAEDLVLEEKKEEVKEVPKEDNIVENITPINNNFESVNIEQPVEIKEELNIVAPSEDIKLETKASEADVAQAESDLDLLAATLLKEYKKETPKEEVTNDQFSSVYVTPDVLPRVEEKKEEAVTPVNMPNFSDIPAPQPVRVVESSTIIDSSKKENTFDINNLENEQYNIKK